MRNSVKKWGVGIAVFAAIVTTAVLLPQDKVTDFHEKYEGCIGSDNRSVLFFAVELSGCQRPCKQFFVDNVHIYIMCHKERNL